MDADDELRVRLVLAFAEIGRLRAQLAAMQRREADALLVDAVDNSYARRDLDP